ncbi:hypothetical protein AMS68_003997 [Peltaster fructicola]|uniref:Uncharacterized protein n=1 Tax=Peltaster fructicola TaxID=286661 RepID=A0A6H0XVK9_9PEZI|nr:hypothetical protein AMS68_003997 [Peltaster fructicola]
MTTFDHHIHHNIAPAATLELISLTIDYREELESPKLEFYKLEQKYTRRDKRTTFHSDARYVNGEYIYNDNKSSSTQDRGSVSFNRELKRTISTRVSEIFPDRRSKIF